MAMRIMWGVLCLTSIVLVYVYTGTLTSRLTAPFRKALVDSVDDVANNQRLVPYVVKMSAVEEHIQVITLNYNDRVSHDYILFQNSHLPSIKTIKKRLEHNPKYRVPITEDPAAMFHEGPDSLLMAVTTTFNISKKIVLIGLVSLKW